MDVCPTFLHQLIMINGFIDQNQICLKKIQRYCVWATL